MNSIITLDSRPAGMPESGNFKFESIEIPKAVTGQVLLKTRYVSIDPYLRGQMDDVESYIPAFKLRKPMQSRIIAEVLESGNQEFSKGDFVHGNLNWAEFQVSTGVGLHKVDEKAAPLSAYLGILGMTGLTAYMGLVKIGAPKPGETIVISGAAGAVGSIAGQIGKIMGCRVIGIVGTDQKVDLIKSKFGFDEGLNYKTEKDLQESIARLCPNGVDVYFDNVGGEISDAVMWNLNSFARVPLCGAISLYNSAESGSGPRFELFMVKKSILMQGFIFDNFAREFPEAILQLTKWLTEGKLTYSETIIDGFQNIPSAFIDLFKGKNEGKMMVRI